MNDLKQAVFLGARTSLLPADVTHLEAEVNYTIVYSASGKNEILSSTMKKVYECLKDHGNFIRISRKYVVNMKFVKISNEQELILSSGKELRPSRRKRKELDQIFR